MPSLCKNFSCFCFVWSGLFFFLFSFHNGFVSVCSCFSPFIVRFFLFSARFCCCSYCTARDSKAKYQHGKGLFITKAGFGLSTRRRRVAVVVGSVCSLCGGLCIHSLSAVVSFTLLSLCCTPTLPHHDIQNVRMGLLHVPLGIAPNVVVL